MYYFLYFVILVATIYLVEKNSLVSQDSNVNVEEAVPLEVLAELRPSQSLPIAKVASAEMAKESIVSGSVKENLELDNSEATELKTALENLQIQSGEQQKRISLYYPSEMSVRDLQIQNLNDVLQTIRQTKFELNQWLTLGAAAQQQSLQALRSTLNPQISSYQQSHGQVQSQITTMATLPLRSVEQDSYLKSLQTQLVSEREELDALQIQLRAIENGAAAQLLWARELALRQMDELNENESEIQSEIYARREEISGLPQAFTNAQMSVMSLEQLTLQSKKNYEIKKTKDLAAKKKF